MRASGARPSAPAAASLPMSTAEAPSFNGDALPAVIVPVGRNAGRSLASDAGVESARMLSSRVRSAPGTGTTRSS